MALTPELESALQEERSVLEQVVASLRAQRNRSASRHHSEATRAAELTAGLVSARRVEDKAMMASDEAVSHALRDKFRGDITGLDALIKKPYFARLIVEEESDSGTREFEYRIGTAGNTECRIIDWRKAPISKLYYEYREGDDYSEVIQGRERCGTVRLRNVLEVENSQLRKLTCSKGTAVLRNGEWMQLGAGAQSGARDRSYSELPSVLALITAEQFRAITEDAQSAVLIQGVAGSGKTTVALHRLAWLLHEDNSDLTATKSIVVAINPVLKLYLERSLQQLGISGVAVRTFSELSAVAVARLIPTCVSTVDGAPQIRRPETRCPSSLDRAKRSLAVFQSVEERAVANSGQEMSAEKIYLDALSDTKRILELDETKLLSRELLLESVARTKENIERGSLDNGDDALLMRLYQLLHGSMIRHDGEQGLYEHLVVDEVQELSSAELATLIGGVSDLRQITLVGDVAQKMSQSSGFSSWEKLRTHWDTSGALSHFVSLSVTHRSTREIMNVAAAVQKIPAITSARTGRPPRWFYSRHESRALTAVIQWISKASELHPAALTAVICRDKREAKLAYSFLSPSFGVTVRLWEDSQASFEEGIVVATVDQTKGLEFTNVVIWNPSITSYPETAEDRSALYVAVTRAEENLCIATWSRPSPLLPSRLSPLFRGMDLDTDDDEESQRSESGR